MTKLAETTTEAGEKVEAHQCEVCGQVHIGQRGPLGILIIPCPSIKPDVILIGGYEFKIE